MNRGYLMSAYELRIYQVAVGEIETLQKIFRELVIPMLPDHRIRSVGYWKAPDDATLNYIVEHESLGVIEGNWERFHADPRWSAGLLQHRGDRKVVLEVKSTTLIGVPGLPPLNGTQAG